MADALVSFMLEKLATVIQDEIQQQVDLVVGAEKEVENLKTTFKQIQAVLNDAEQRQIKDEAVKLWLEEFKDIAYDMDDVLDEWSYEMHKSQNDTGEGNKKKVTSSYLCSLCSCFSKVSLRHNIGTKIKDIKERLDLAESEKQKYRFVEMNCIDKPIERLKSSSLVDVTDIIGRATDKETIMSKLMFLGKSSTSTTQPESSSTKALHAPNIISIVGMGGLGKTTLAQLVFNDDQVKTHFEKTMWVCVSDPFDLVTVTKAIIEEAKCKVPKSSEWNTLHHSLSESIKGKRFLLVLDDVWTEDRSIWEPLEVSFRYGAKGSRILVTTRNERVALMMNATYTHSLGVLSFNDCSLLLRRIALAGRNVENHEELKEISEEISKKCKGLPLAAKTLGGLLHFKKNKKEWFNILESEFWKLEDFENGFLKPALLLSYYDLPLPLKGCFVYCSIFPKDHVIKKDLLVKLWMAQGFLKSTSGNEDLEAIGEDYFNNLVMRSFFQDFTKDNNGNIIWCKMHDLVHDFAQFLTKNECSFTQINIDDTQFLNSSSRVRHLTIECENQGRNSTDCYDRFTSSVCNAKKLRTLQILNEGALRIKEAPADLFHRFRCLKVLCLNRIGLENLSGEIGKLIHLRYLDLSENFDLKILPETISNLYNLQTLKLMGCRSLSELPREMWRMINLRHLDLRETFELSHIPQGIGGLTSLRTLSKFIVGGASEGCKLSELKNLNLLQGDLIIEGLGRVETVSETLEMGMKQKQLHSLTLGFEHNEERENELLSKRMEDVLDVLEPHPDVVELVVDDYLGFKLSRWMESTSILSHMKTLNLFGCINLTKFPAFGQLPSLEVLCIERAIKVTHIGFEFYSNSTSLEHVNRVVPFPKLKELQMLEMDNLEVWELQHGVVMPCLLVIEVRGCPKLKALPALGKLPSLEELVIQRAKELTHIGCEFYSNSTSLEHVNRVVPFPKLKKLRMELMDSLEVWELQHGVVMPCLRFIEVLDCPKLKALPALGKLLSLEELVIKGAKELTHIGCEFYSNSTSLEHVNRVVPFPKLKKLRMKEMDNLEVWELQHGVVMPCLLVIEVDGCPKLKALPALGKLPSLEELVIKGAKELTHIGCEFLYEVDEEEAGGDVRFNNNTTAAAAAAAATATATAAFPKLKSLSITEGSKELEWEFAGGVIMPCLRSVDIQGLKPFLEILSKISSLEILKIWGGNADWFITNRHDDDDDEIILFPNLKELRLYVMEDMEELKIGFQTMPLLNNLKILNCNKLKAIQGESLSKLESLELDGCASLYELRIPNLKRLYISKPPIHPSLPEAFATTLQALEVLIIWESSWTCIPEQVQQLTSLKRLQLWECGDELEQRCRKDEGEDWRIISHIPNIQINRRWITKCD